MNDGSDWTIFNFLSVFNLTDLLFDLVDDIFIYFINIHL
jgi:hypothetical protein